MSGQPVKTKSDQTKYLDDYMENLALEISLQKSNEEANRVYKATGQLPPVSSMPDNRTVEQKLADVEGLKQGIIFDLKKSLASNLASSLVDEIMKSRYNVDNSLLRFFAQRAPEIMREIEKKYKYGLSDYNDVIGTSKFIENYYIESQKTLASFKDISSRSRASDDANVPNILFKLEKVLRDLQNLIMTKTSGTDWRVPYAFRDNLNMLIRKVSIMIDVCKTSSLDALLPRQQVVNQDFLLTVSDIAAKAYTYAVNEPGSPFNIDVQDLIQKVGVMRDAWSEVIPDPDLLSTFVSKLTKFVEIEPRNPAQVQPLFDIYAKEIRDMFEDVSIQELIGLMALKEDIEELIARLRPSFRRFASTTDESIVRAASLDQPINIPMYPMTTEQEKLDMIGGLFDILYDKFAPGGPAPVGMQAQLDAAVGTPQDYTNAPVNNKRQMVQDLIDFIDNSGVQQIIDEKDDLLRNQPNYQRIINGFGFRRRMRGGSIAPTAIPITRGRPKKPVFKERIDTEAGMKSSPDFVPFGAYLINRRKMGEGIVNLKTASGSNLHGFPNKRVSTNLAKVFHKIIGGSIPSFEDLSALDEEEKAYLHKVAKKSNLLDRLSIPSPSKDQIEKDIHNFEVMKGQIMSGNDNKDLVKKFKLSVLKLKHQGLLPKAQADEIIADISALGY